MRKIKNRSLINRLRTNDTITEVVFNKVSGKQRKMVAIGCSEQPDWIRLRGRTLVKEVSTDGTQLQYRIVDNRTVKKLVSKQATVSESPPIRLFPDWREVSNG